MNARDQEAVFGREFEKLDQSRRVQVLVAYGLLDDPAKRAFETIRTTRRKYLHLWSQDHETLPADAISVYHSAVVLVAKAIGQGVSGGAAVLNPALVRYLERAGLYRPEPDDAVMSGREDR
jgi:hypothetical protein